ncbi:MAG: metal-dependent hydrolase [Candidatus Aenigmarchaeota archaeon]|nr:metal-dependent hydrolase [Candidatus Aenigmarchaeota archaeon]
MQKYTHLVFAFLVFLLLNQVFHYPLYLAFIAFIGTMLPDLDIKVKNLHRKIFHNLWFLALVLFVLFRMGLIDNQFAIIFSIGFISHLVADSLTHMGIMPLWPIPVPKFNGPVKTGSLGEFGVLIFLIIIIFMIGGLI